MKIDEGDESVSREPGGGGVSAIPQSMAWLAANWKRAKRPLRAARHRLFWCPRAHGLPVTHKLAKLDQCNDRGSSESSFANGTDPLKIG